MRIPVGAFHVIHLRKHTPRIKFISKDKKITNKLLNVSQKNVERLQTFSWSLQYFLLSMSHSKSTWKVFDILISPVFYKLLEVVYNIHIYLFFVLSIRFKSTGTHKEKKITTLRETLSNIAITLSSCYNYDPCCIVYKGGKI